MPGGFADESISWLERALVVILAITCAFFVASTRLWPLVGDASLIHYAVFLMQHGRAPYKDIVDINMPGMYLVDWAVIKTIGGGALAWRLFDFLLMVLAAAGMLVIAWPSSRFAGFFSAALFMLVHGRDGIPQAGQRDLIIAVLLLVSLAFLLLAIRTSRLSLTLVAGFLIGTAVTIKPTVAIFGVVIIVATPAFEEIGTPVWRTLALAVAGWAVPLVVTAVFLWRWHALPAFWETLHGLLPFHASLDHRPFLFLILHSVSPLLPLVILWAYLAIKTRCWQKADHAILFTAIACGLLSYCIQAKGYPYHRYPLLGFLLVSMGIVFAAGLRGKGSDKLVGALGVLFGVLVIAPVSAFKASTYDWRNQEFITMLQSDLERLGGVGLSGQIQCMDMTAGCINTLYRMNLVQSTGFLYDCYFFVPAQTKATGDLRIKFWHAVSVNPPRVFVVSNQFCLGQAPGYGKLESWPQFHEYLAQNYIISEERIPPHSVRWWSLTQVPLGYRIYVRK